MENDLTCLWVGVLVASMAALMLKQSADQRKDDEYLRRAAHLGGSHRRRMDSYAGRRLRWIKAGAHQYHLCAEDAHLASLYLKSSGQMDSVQSAEGAWVAQYGPWWRPACTVYKADASRLEATLKSRVWSGTSTAMLADGQQYAFRRGNCYSAANERLISFGDRGRTVSLESGASMLPSLALLVLLGSTLMLQSTDYSDD
jgi:hypothetical protein